MHQNKKTLIWIKTISVVQRIRLFRVHQ